MHRCRHAPAAAQRSMPQPPQPHVLQHSTLPGCTVLSWGYRTALCCTVLASFVLQGLAPPNLSYELLKSIHCTQPTHVKQALTRRITTAPPARTREPQCNVGTADHPGLLAWDGHDTPLCQRCCNIRSTLLCKMTTYAHCHVRLLSTQSTPSTQLVLQIPTSSALWRGTLPTPAHQQHSTAAAAVAGNASSGAPVRAAHAHTSVAATPDTYSAHAITSHHLASTHARLPQLPLPLQQQPRPRPHAHTHAKHCIITTERSAQNTPQQQHSPKTHANPKVIHIVHVYH